MAVLEYFNKNIEIKIIDNLIWKIAHNIWCAKAKSYIKEKNNTSINDINEPFIMENLIDKIVYKEIINNLDCINLTEKEKISFKMYYIEDYSIKEISKKLNTSESNIKYYLFSARKKVKERYCE